jgi:hypothetical protein
MSKHPNEPTAPLRVVAEIAKDPETGEWVATSIKHGKLATSSIEIRRARDTLEKQLADKLGRPVEIVEKIQLPKGLAEDVATYQNEFAQFQELEAKLDAKFMPLVKRLLRERLQQRHIAGLLHISKQRLGQMLKEEAMGGTPRRGRG